MGEREDDTNADYGLLVSFEDQSDSYVHGFEAGLISARMKSGIEAEIKATVHTANRETITRMAIAYGWSALFETTQFEEWSEVTMEKTGKAPERPNPIGLRLVRP